MSEQDAAQDTAREYDVELANDMQNMQEARAQVLQDMRESDSPVLDMPPMFQSVIVTAQAAHRLGKASKSIADDAEYREDAPEPANADYLGFRHEHMKAMLDGVDPGTVSKSAEVWTKHADGLTTAQGDMLKAISESESGWQGEAGDSARQQMAELADWIGKAGQRAQLAGDAVTRQADAIETAKSSMPQPVPFDLQQAQHDIAQITDPAEYHKAVTGMRAQHARSEAAREQAAHVMSTLDTNLAETGKKQPSFPPLKPPAGTTPGSTGPAPNWNGPGVSNAGDVPNGPGSHQPGRVGDSVTAPGSDSDASVAGIGGDPYQQPGLGGVTGPTHAGLADESYWSSRPGEFDSGGTSAQSWTPSTGTGGTTGVGSLGSTSGGLGGSAFRPTSGIGGGSPGVTPLGGMGSGGRIPAGSSLPLGRVGSVPGAPPGVGAKFGASSGSSPGAGVQSGTRSLSGQPTGRVSGTPAAASGRAGGGRMPMMGGAGAGRGQGGGESEHERKYVQDDQVISSEDERLYDPDGNLVTPPVIGT